MNRRIIFLFAFVIFAAGLYGFYIKYVPLIRPFQLVLLPLLLIVSVLTAADLNRGTLLFIFLFPLVNSLPYFFGIFEQTPHGPSALVLFLFYFWGWLLHNALFTPPLSFKHPLFRPMILFSILVSVSGIITFLRYAHFYPFLADDIYELSTNVRGVTSGGAMMSTLFFALNYLTGFAFFFILSSTIKNKDFIRKILIVLLLSTSVALCFGFYQHFRDITFGNTPMRINESIINATFKDPLSFGAFLSLLTPVLLAGIIAFKGILRLMSIILFIGGLFLLPQTGSKSGVVGVVFSLVFFLVFSLSQQVQWKKWALIPRRRIIASVTVIILVMAVVFLVVSLSKESEAFKRLTGGSTPYGGLKETIKIRWLNQWRMAGQMIMDYPLTGVGIGAYIIELPNYATQHQGRYQEWVDSAENYFLQAGSELGLISLLLCFWIFWEIFKAIRKSMHQYFGRFRWKYFQIGISCAIISLFLIFLVHTYIGSYEIKYTFWLMVALIFSLWRLEDKAEEKTLFSRNAKILIVLFAIIFSAVHLWNSTHSLSLKDRSERFDLKQDFGFYKVEETQDGTKFRWTKGSGGLMMTIEKPVIEIPLLASHPDLEINPVRLKILLIKDFFKQKRLLADFMIREPVWKTYTYPLPEEVGQEVILLFKVSRTWNPLEAKGLPDPRNLGVALGQIQFREE